MTTYKIGEVLTDQDGCSRVKMEEDTAGEWVRKQDVRKLLERQRNADALAAQSLVMEMLNHETELPYPEKAEWAKSMERAIFKAEVQP